MNNNERFEQLWNDYLEGELHEDGIAELQQLLASDDSLLRAAADSFQVHRLLGLKAEDSETRHEDFVRATMGQLPSSETEFVGDVMKMLPVRRTGKPFSYLLVRGVVAAGLLLLVALLFFRTSVSPEVARITGLHGAVQWTGEGGIVQELDKVGEVLRGGTLESQSADAWAELTYRDGTTVTVSGRSLLTLSEPDQKIVHLRYGNVSANVAPQPTGQPMLVQTPSAELEIVGTQFNLDAESSRTTLAVNEGLVRLKRLTDGEVVDVPANHQAVASVEEHNGLEVTIRGTAAHSWHSDLAKDATNGKWSSDLRVLGVKLKKAVGSGKLTRKEAVAKYKAAANLSEDSGVLYATPWLTKQLRSGTKSDVSYLAALSVTRGRTIPVVANAGSAFRIVGQAESSTKVRFGITTLAPDGGFAGKYFVVRTIEVSESDGSFDIEVPLLEFQPVAAKKFAKSPSGQELADWWCITKGKDVKLAIRRVELLPAMSP